MKKITKAVFPVAGMGSRFLPATKVSPKEMMPIVDKPLIQYAVEEAAAAGITDMVFITGRNKRAIEDHFDKAYELEAELAMRGKEELLRLVREVTPAHINCIYIRQTEPLGLGHAVLCARPVVQDEPFAVLLADDLIDGEPPIIKQMVDVFQKHQCSILGVQNVPREQTGQYGIVSSVPLSANLEQVKGIVEKPRPEDAPSTLAVVGALHSDAADFSSPGKSAGRCGRRNSIDRWHRCFDTGRKDARLSLQRNALRLRLQAGIS